MKKVLIYYPNGVTVYQVGNDKVLDIHFNGRAVRVDYENGDHHWISGFPFEYISPKPVGISDRQLLEE